jgi:hypothetical protein
MNDAVVRKISSMSSAFRKDMEKATRSDEASVYDVLGYVDELPLVVHHDTPDESKSTLDEENESHNNEENTTTYSEYFIFYNYILYFK